MREVISRALIIKENKVLLCRRKGTDYWFLPGGHIDLGENGKDALIRELKEERGSQIKISAFVGVIENFFEQDGEEIYEINLIFQAEELGGIDETTSNEDHLEFKFIKLNEFKKEKILPLVVKYGIVQWIQNKKPFYLYTMLKR
jgi:ADP-ribose pyrophosphatase YjhB (NUDIX family)